MKKYVFILFCLSCTYVLANSDISTSNSLAHNIGVEVNLRHTANLQYGAIHTVVLYGTPYAMGAQYGLFLKKDLYAVRSILFEYFIDQMHLTHEQLASQAESLYARFPSDEQVFMQGEAIGSGVSLTDVKILNAMETLLELVPNSAPMCAFMFIPPNHSLTQNAFIGRNYDYPAPFDKLTKYITVAVLKQHYAHPVKDSKIATAIISIAGEIYCPSCINSKGLFMELNNGMPSGGDAINTNTTSMLARMLQTLQNSNSINDVVNSLNEQQSDFSLIVNVADSNTPVSFEFSSNPKLGMKYYYPQSNDTFANTNYFLNPAWGNEIPIPTDISTWLGITRRDNLLNLASESGPFNLATVENLMETNIENGGAFWTPTIYQLIYDSSDMYLYIRSVQDLSVWNLVPLNYLFTNNF